MELQNLTWDLASYESLEKGMQEDIQKGLILERMGEVTCSKDGSPYFLKTQTYAELNPVKANIVKPHIITSTVEPKHTKKNKPQKA